MARSNTASTSNWISRAASPIATANATHTIACWFNPASVAVTQNIVVLSDGAAAQYSALIFDGANSYAFGAKAIVTDQTGGSPVATTTVIASASTWNHLALTVTSSTSRAVYLNGGGKQTGTNAGSTSALSQLDIGALNNGASRFSPMNGSVAEVGIWNVVLTDAEILSLSKGISPLLIRPAALVAYYPLWGAGDLGSRVSNAALTINGTMAAAAHVPQFYFNPVDFEPAVAAASNTGKGDATGLGTASGLAGFLGAATGVGTATGRAGFLGAASGVGTATGRSGSIGEATGAGTASAFSGSIGAASGLGAATGLAGSIGAASGTGTATGLSGSIGQANGTGTALADSQTGSDTATGAASGLGTASGFAGSIGVATGTGTATGLAGAIGSATGTGTATGFSGAKGQANGVGAATGFAGFKGAATGTGTATGLAGSIGQASGVGSAAGFPQTSASDGVGEATGTGTASGFAGSIGSATGAGIATGYSTALASSSLGGKDPGLRRGRGGHSAIQEVIWQPQPSNYNHERALLALLLA